MRTYTTVEQSNRLIESGLDPKTADMHYSANDVIIDNLPDKHIEAYPMINKNDAEYTVPCWSAGCLMSLMPDMIGRNKEVDENGNITYKDDNKCGASAGFLSINKNHEGEWVFSYDDGWFDCVRMDPEKEDMPYNYAIRMNETLIDTAVDMMIWLIENGFVENKNVKNS